MMGKRFLLASSALVAAAWLVTPASAASGTVSKSDYAALEQRVEKLESQLEQKNDQQQAINTRLTTVEQTANDVQWSFDNARPTVKSGDGRFSMAVRTRFQFDAASFDQSPGKNAQFKDLGSGAVIRRAYFGVEGLTFKDFWYEFRMNFGGSNAESPSGDPNVNLARVSYIGIPHFRINAGIIQPVFTYGDTVSSASLTFLEKGDIVNVAADSYGGADSRRGVEMSFQKTDVLHGGDNFVLSGAYTGNKTGSANGHANLGDEQTQVLGRVVYRLWSDGPSNFQIGASGADITHVDPTTHQINLGDRPEIRVNNDKLVTTGNIFATGGSMYGLDAAGNIGSFYLAGEYHHYTIDRDRGRDPTPGNPSFSGWYVEGSYILTGETKTYSAGAMNNELGTFNAPRVVSPFSLDGHSWGAWEVAVRYSDLSLDYHEGMTGFATPLGGVRGGEEKIWTAGLNWYLNNNVRLMFDYQNVAVNKLGASKPWPQIGQNFNVYSVRLQFAN
jgi:phosphate-selective porin OprO/OprP